MHCGLAASSNSVKFLQDVIYQKYLDQSNFSQELLKNKKEAEIHGMYILAYYAPAPTVGGIKR